MKRDFSRVVLTLENVLIPDDKLCETPSMSDGLDKEVETDLRILGCELIQTAGILLKLPQVRGSVKIYTVNNVDSCESAYLKSFFCVKR